MKRKLLWFLTSPLLVAGTLVVCAGIALAALTLTVPSHVLISEPGGGGGGTPPAATYDIKVYSDAALTQELTTSSLIEWGNITKGYSSQKSVWVQNAGNTATHAGLTSDFAGGTLVATPVLVSPGASAELIMNLVAGSTAGEKNFAITFTSTP